MITHLGLPANARINAKITTSVSVGTDSIYKLKWGGKSEIANV